MNKVIKLDVNTQEAVFIYNVLGQLPTNSNAHPLFMKVASQIQTQAPEMVKEQDKASNEVEIVQE